MQFECSNKVFLLRCDVFGVPIVSIERPKVNAACSLWPPSLRYKQHNGGGGGRKEGREGRGGYLVDLCRQRIQFRQARIIFGPFVFGQRYSGGKVVVELNSGLMTTFLENYSRVAG